MSFFERNQIILAAIESTYGTDATPVEGSNAILTKNLERTIYEGERVSRDLNRPYMGNDYSINTGPYVTVRFDVEIAGSGTPGTPPQWGPLLRACGASEVIVSTAGSESVTYAPVSKSFESTTIYYNYDGELQKIIGARGTAQLSLSSGGLPMISFTFTGKYQKPTAVPLYNPTYTAVAPLPFNNINTTTFSLFAQAVKGESFSLDLACNVVHRNLVGHDVVEIVDRSPTANAVFEAVTIATKDFFAAMESHNGVTEGPFQLVHGTTAGNIVTLDLGQTQLSNINEQSSDMIRMFSADLIPVPTDSGNDDWSIALT